MLADIRKVADSYELLCTKLRKSFRSISNFLKKIPKMEKWFLDWTTFISVFSIYLLQKADDVFLSEMDFKSFVFWSDSSNIYQSKCRIVWKKKKAGRILWRPKKSYNFYDFDFFTSSGALYATAVIPVTKMLFH